VISAKTKALRGVSREAARAKLAIETRNAVIRHALETSSVREVAVAAQLSSARVHQIRHGR
jgi:hypothetical protein